MISPNAITFGKSVYQEDFSSASLAARALFVHEMAHQWQYSEGIDVKIQAVLEYTLSQIRQEGPRATYDYSKLFRGVSFESLPKEAQASLIADVYVRLEGYQPPTQPTLSQLMSVLPTNLRVTIAAFQASQALQDHLEEQRCFVAGTLISMADHTKKPIEAIQPDDMVLAFDPTIEAGRGALVPRRVVRTFVNENK